MAIVSLARPVRRLAFPFVVVLYPLLWFVLRDAGIAASGQPAPAVLPQTLALALTAVVVSYIVAVAVAAMLASEPGSASGWTRQLLFPSDGALVTFTAVSVALGAFIVVGSAFAFPGWFETVATVVGGVIGWPLIVVYGGTIVVENALGGQSAAVEFVAVGIGVALSVAWLFLLSGWIAAIVRRTDSAGVAIR